MSYVFETDRALGSWQRHLPSPSILACRNFFSVRKLSFKKYEKFRLEIPHFGEFRSSIDISAPITYSVKHLQLPVGKLLFPVLPNFLTHDAAVAGICRAG